jgi:hypothetical protein
VRMVGYEGSVPISLSRRTDTDDRVCLPRRLMVVLMCKLEAGSDDTPPLCELGEM